MTHRHLGDEKNKHFSLQWTREQLVTSSALSVHLAAVPLITTQTCFHMFARQAIMTNVCLKESSQLRTTLRSRCPMTELIQKGPFPEHPYSAPTSSATDHFGGFGSARGDASSSSDFDKVAEMETFETPSLPRRTQNTVSAFSVSPWSRFHQAGRLTFTRRRYLTNNEIHFVFRLVQTLQALQILVFFFSLLRLQWSHRPSHRSQKPHWKSAPKQSTSGWTQGLHSADVPATPATGCGYSAQVWRLTPCRPTVSFPLP